MSSIENQASNVRPPYKGAIYVATATTTTGYVIFSSGQDPVTGETVDYFQNRYVTLQADGGDIYIALGEDTNAISPTAAAGDFDAANCIKIPQDQRLDLWIPKGTFSTLCFITATGTATLRMWPSSYPNNSR